MAENITEITEENGITIISFGAPNISIDGSIEKIDRQISNLIENHRPMKVIVDFTGVRFFSSRTLGVLISAYKKISAYDGSIVISGINPQLYRVFKITNLDKIFKFYPDNSSAANDFGV